MVARSLSASLLNYVEKETSGDTSSINSDQTVLQSDSQLLILDSSWKGVGVQSSTIARA